MADFDWDAVNDEIEMRINTPMTVTVEIVAMKPEDIERENKRLRSIAERRAERDALDAERKEREAKRAEIKRQEELAKPKPKPSTKSLFEQERDEFVANFVRNIKAEDMKAGRGHLWIGRNRAGDKAPKLSKGEVDAQTKAMYAWRIHKKL